MKLKPFHGITVVSLEQAVAAPYCTSRLAQAGARVIKVERPDGDFARGYDRAVHGHSSYFLWLNSGKESIALDLKQADDLALMRRLIARADVFIQNLAPGAVERLGLGSEALRSLDPRLITLDISGYGKAGERADLKAYDFLVQGESGLLAVSGAPEAYGRIGVSLCDIGAGMYALSAVQQALFLREKTGQGASLHVSLFSAAFDWMAVPLLHQRYGAGAPARVGLQHPSIAPYGGFRCADDEILLISVQNNREFLRLCEQVLDDASLAQDPRFRENAGRVKHRETLDGLIAAKFATLTRPQMEKALRSADIAFGGINAVAAVANHAQARYWPMTLGGDQIHMMAPPFDADWQDGSFDPVPEIDQHGEAIRREFAA
ncbi:MAG: CoA transferase [Betaproteobacteria bacterium]|nr:CoA transferase [Betaproteobacteria bacterium]